MVPERLELTTLEALLRWFEMNLCDAELRDPRGFRVRFLPTDFVHLVKMTTKYGEEPRNKAQTLVRIRREEISLRLDRIDTQRAHELPWAAELIQRPDFICPNWVPEGKGTEAYVKDFGSEDAHQYRVMICERTGKVRRVVTIFPREKIGEGIRASQSWP
jgi:hypothetical protein